MRQRIAAIAMKKTRSIQFLCSLLIGVIFMLVIFAGLMIYDRINASSTTLTISTNSAAADYDSTPLTNHQWTLLHGGLQEGHKIIANFTGSQTDAGISENTMTVTIVDENGRDVTGDYVINYEYGTLQINHRLLRLDAATDFEGLSPTNGKYTLTSDHINLVPGHYAVVSVSTTTDELGLPVESIEKVTVYDEQNQDVTHNYHIYTREKGDNILIPVDGTGSGGISTSLSGETGGGESLEPMQPMFSVRSDVSGLVYFRTRSCGDYLGDGWDTAPTFPALYDDCYAASYLTSFYMEKRNYTLRQMEIVSHIPDYPLPYYAGIGEDYTIQRNDTVNIGSAEGSYIVPFYLYTGNPPSATHNSDAFENAYRSFVYDNYTAIDQETLDFMNGIIASQQFSKQSPTIVQKVASYIQQAAKYNKDYDRSLDKSTNNAIAFLSQYKEGVCRHYATAATLLYRALGFPARFTVGAVAEVTAHQWVDIMPDQAHAWVEVYIDGVGWIPVEVTGADDAGSDGVCEDCGDSECDGNCGGEGGGNGSGQNGPGGNLPGLPKTLELKPITVTKKFDGTPLTSNGLVSGLEDLEHMGYTYSATISGTRTEVGVTESIIESITIYDSRGKDVTSSFEIVTKPGRIHVYHYEISFQSHDIQRPYNGTPPQPGVFYDSKDLVSGHIVTVRYTGDPNVGTKESTYEITIYDSAHNDVTDQYLIHPEFCTAVITPVEITLQAGSASKKYDGSPLTCQDFEIHKGILIDGHVIQQAVTVGSQTEIGRSDNIISSVVIVDAEGNDVTANYTIQLIAGKLRVTAS